LGSTRVVTNAAGAKIAEYKFAPYGEKEVASGDGTEYGFTDKAEDESTGLSYFGARFYDPEVGRFITQDPVKSGRNWFAYCLNNPLRYIDPLGLDTETTETSETTITTVTEDITDDKGNIVGTVTTKTATAKHGNARTTATTRSGKDGRTFTTVNQEKQGGNGWSSVFCDQSIGKDGKEIWGATWSVKNNLNLDVRGATPAGVYVDFNVSGGYWVGASFGWIISDDGRHFYIGGGIVSPGVSVAVTIGQGNSRSCQGWNAAAQGAYNVAGQRGYNISQGSWYNEVGIGTPGFGATLFYVF
jgi:RHS repeat-associated protein